jgi:glycosyltransferase involved in cell wall biosynthesis
LINAEAEESIHIRQCLYGESKSDAEGFYKGLLYSANNAKMRETFGRQGRRFVESQYGKDRLINDIKKLYRALIET